MEEETMLSEDGRIVRVDNPWWSFYIDTELAPGLDERRCGKWMFYFNDIEFANEVCCKAALGRVVAKCKHSSSKTVIESGSGVVCFYLNYNIGFKLDDQTRAGEYGTSFKARITLSDFVDLESGEFL